MDDLKERYLTVDEIANGNWSVTIENLPYSYQYVAFLAKDRLDNI